MNLFGILNPKSYWAKGVFAVFAFSVFFIGTAYLLNYKTPEELLLQKIEKEVSLTDEQKTLVSKKLQELSKDSDSDGLKDWEEIIYRTDSQNADTDGDETKDGEEIKQNRNPLVKSPNDAEKQPRQETLAAENEENFKNNRSYDFLKKIAGAIKPQTASEGQITEGEIDPAALQELIEEITNLKDQALEDLSPITITNAGLKILPQNDPASVKKYFNSLVDAYISAGSGVTESDFTILTRALEEKNFAELKKLDAIIAANDKALQKIKKIPVPAGYESFAVYELNYLTQTKHLIENFKDAENDPWKVLSAFQARSKIVQDMVSFQEKTGKELAQKGIVFEPSESAYLIFQ